MANWYKHRIVDMAAYQTAEDAERELGLLGANGYHVVATCGTYIILEKFYDADSEILKPGRESHG